MNSNIKTYKFLFYAQLTKLSIKTTVTSPISASWKRSNQVAKTSIVQFAGGMCQFNQTLKLNVNMYYDQSIKCFQQKKSQFLFTLHTPKGDKLAGSVNVDLAIMLNNQLHIYEQDFKLDKCPDKDAKIHIKIKFESLGQSFGDTMSQLNSSTIMNDSSMISGTNQTNTQNNASTILGNTQESHELKELKQKVLQLNKQNQYLRQQLNNSKKPNTGDEQSKKQIEKLNKQLALLKGQMLKSKSYQEKLEKELSDMRSDHQNHDKQLENTRVKLETVYEKIVSALGNLI